MCLVLVLYVESMHNLLSIHVLMDCEMARHVWLIISLLSTFIELVRGVNGYKIWLIISA